MPGSRARIVWLARLCTRLSALGVDHLLASPGGQSRYRRRAAAGAGTAAAVALMMGVAAGSPSALAATASRAFAGHGQLTAAAGAAGAAWGDNSAGELGDGTLTASTRPAAVSGLSGVRAVSAGGRHELALLSGGTVVAWGDDTFGQLGNGVASSNGDSEVPAAVAGLTGVTAVAAGEEHSLALLTNGTVMAWGDNREGQLGDGSMVTSTVPVPVKGLTGVRAIAAGSLFSLALLANGTVVAWGRNDSGQLGNGSLTDSDVPVPVKGLTGVTAIAAGGKHSLALLGNGTVMAWGSNESSQLGDGQDVTTQPLSEVPVPVVKLTGVRAIAAGFQHSLALTSGGSLRVWGDNAFFQLARPNGFPGGIADSDVPLSVPGVGKATAIAAGGLFSLAVVSGGGIRGWGDNAFGQLGNGTAVTSPSPVTVTGLSGATAVAAGGVQAIALVPAAGRPGVAAAPGGPVSSPWRVAGSPVDPGGGSTGIKDVIFDAVSSTSSTDAWAVGASDALLSSRPLAEHWNGRAWARAGVPLPPGAASGTLAGVDELTPTDGWAVGSTQLASSGAQRTLIEHWDGTRWVVVPSPNPQTGTGAFDGLAAIAGTSAHDVWAVGSYSNGSTFIAMLFAHWDGKTWRFIKGPISGFQFGTAVTAISPSDAWAVGNTSTATVSAHWNGHRWSRVATPILQDGKAPQNFLTGVTATGPGNVWASGYEGNVNQQNLSDPYLLHWTGGPAWKLVKVPNPGSEGSQLRGVSAISATDVWAAGLTLQTDGGLLSLTEHFNGRTWAVAPSLDPGDLADIPDSTFAAIASVPPHLVFAVGTQEIPTRCCLLALAERTTRG